MTLDRRPVMAAYVLILVGFLLAVLVAGSLPTPAPPACSTDVCTASYVSDLLGLVLLIIGIVYLGVALFRAPRVPDPGTPAGPVYSFPGSTPPTPPPSTPSPIPSGSGARFCPECGSQVTTDFGFCPRCGHSVPK